MILDNQWNYQNDRKPRKGGEKHGRSSPYGPWKPSKSRIYMMSKYVQMRQPLPHYI